MIKKISFSFLILMVSIFIFSCSTRTCKPGESLAEKNMNNPAVSAAAAKASPMNNQIKKIRVFKLDGSVQCEPSSGVAVDLMAKELDGVKIYSSENKSDGLIRIQQCGKPTGKCNVFEIADTDFAKAEKLGFKKWKNE